MNGKIRIVVKVAEKRDGEAFQPGRPTPERNFLANDSRTVGRNQRGVGSESGHSCGRCEANKFSSGRRKKRQSVSGPYSAGLRRAVSTSQNNPNPRIRDIPGEPTASEAERSLQVNFAVGGSAG